MFITQLVLLDGDDLEDSFTIERPPIEPFDDGILPTDQPRVSSIPKELTSQLKSVLKAAEKLKPDLNVPENFHLTIISEVLAARLREYSTSVAEDEKLLEEGRATGRRRMAVVVRMEEKRILSEAKAVVDAKMEGRMDGQPSAKRQKVS
jgi:Rubisco LSMT substrate-binding